MTKCACSHENKIIEFLADSLVIAKVKSGGRSPVRHMRCAISLMLRHDVGRLPVVDRANEKRVVGYLAAPALWQRASVIIAMSKYVNGNFVNQAD